jgi:hypothetical protein
VTDRRVECRDFYVPWGQRRFALHDPSGTWVDVIQPIDPQPGFWDKYL